VKKDTKRFQRAVSADGDETDILSTLGAETVKSDSQAFSELMKHIRQKDADQQTVTQHPGTCKLADCGLATGHRFERGHESWFCGLGRASESA
jgi:hypothetical protein